MQHRPSQRPRKADRQESHAGDLAALLTILYMLAMLATAGTGSVSVANLDISALTDSATDQATLKQMIDGVDAAISSIHFLASDPAKLIGAAKVSGVGRYLVHIAFNCVARNGGMSKR